MCGWYKVHKVRRHTSRKKKMSAWFPSFWIITGCCGVHCLGCETPPFTSTEGAVEHRPSLLAVRSLLECACWASPWVSLCSSQWWKISSSLTSSTSKPNTPVIPLNSTAYPWPLSWFTLVSCFSVMKPHDTKNRYSTVCLLIFYELSVVRFQALSVWNYFLHSYIM